MLIRNTAAVAVSIPVLGLDVGPGDVFEAPDELAAELLARPGFAESDGSGASPGTVDEVLADVGDDPALAAAALASESERAKPRKSLVEALGQIIEAHGPDTPKED